MRTTQALILGGLVSFAAFCACVCLTFPAVAFAALFEIDDHGPPPWIPAGVIFRATLIPACFAGLRVGWSVGRDWLQVLEGKRNESSPSPLEGEGRRT